MSLAIRALASSQFPSVVMLTKAGRPKRRAILTKFLRETPGNSFESKCLYFIASSPPPVLAVTGAHRRAAQAPHTVDLPDLPSAVSGTPELSP